MLLPALKSAKNQAHTIACTSNLRQLLLGVINYTVDYNGYYPVYNADPVNPNAMTSLWWPNVISEYVPVKKWAAVTIGAMTFDPGGSVWSCPAVNSKDVYWGGGYGANADGPIALPAPAPANGRGYNRGDFMKRPCDMVVIGDASLGSTVDKTYPIIRYPAGTSDWFLPGTPQCAKRHAAGSNVIFIDGHFESVKWLDLYNQKSKYFEWWH
jgi:prepilin-type processing-associated H-X9-DG protein